VFREIFTKRILGAIAFAIVFGLACYALGMWQLSRYEAKDARANAVEANYARAAVPLAQVLPSPASALGEDQIWSKVTVTGRYAVDRTLVVRTRSLASALGLEVLVPLRVGDATLLVDRGWVRLGETAAELPAFPAAPTEEVTVTGWLKPSEDDRGQNLPAGQLASINLPQAQGQIGGTLYQAYLVMDTERTASGLTPQRPAPLEPPSVDRGPHFAYALQWWLTAGLGIAFVVFLYRSRPGAAERRAEATPKLKKVRIWDEEDG
jgi:cytochrome oxidase assembly protein ShyY1